jgi:hypothetical protein
MWAMDHHPTFRRGESIIARLTVCAIRGGPRCKGLA